MKKFFKVSVLALAATILTTVLVSATVAAFSEEKVEFESKAVPAANCSLALGQARAIYNLMPQEVQTLCRQEYAVVSRKCAQKSDYTYQGVRIRTAPHDDLVDITLSYAGNTLTVKNASWESLNDFFSE